MSYIYNGTLTFKPHWTFERKRKFISSLFKWLETDVFFDTRKGVEYFFEYVVEYHKVDGQDDLEAPHLHFVLTLNKYLPKYLFTSYLKRFSDVGRCQFYLATSLKANSYYKYIMKDVEKNVKLDDVQGYRHHMSKLLCLSDEIYFDDLISE